MNVHDIRKELEPTGKVGTWTDNLQQYQPSDLAIRVLEGERKRRKERNQNAHPKVTAEGKRVR